MGCRRRCRRRRTRAADTRWRPGGAEGEVQRRGAADGGVASMLETFDGEEVERVGLLTETGAVV